MTLFLENISNHRSILCLDGDIPYSILKRINLPIIAADGAANALIKKGIEPYVIIGDLDSVEEDYLKNRNYIKIKEQGTTDFEKSLAFIREQKLSPTIVTGMNGGNISRILENICLLSQTDFIALSKDTVCLPIQGQKILNLPLNTKISIFGAPEAIIKTAGLKWELNEEKLSIGERNSYSNRSISSQVEFTILKGKALIFITFYHFHYF
ncbi:MAG: thiamine diphosphokinase [Holosporaceae bacterium]|jgi:thiamine pyrophosphokinase|nr:thiamine diphosphokinase [Holosporaceae bacterium]